jgi:hypothetical protein
MLLGRVMEWFQQRGIEKGDPSTVQEEYLDEKRKTVAQAVKTANSLNLKHTGNSDKKGTVRLRRPTTFKVTQSDL